MVAGLDSTAAAMVEGVDAAGVRCARGCWIGERVDEELVVNGWTASRWRSEEIPLQRRASAPARSGSGHTKEEEVIQIHLCRVLASTASMEGGSSAVEMRERWARGRGRKRGYIWACSTNCTPCQKRNKGSQKRDGQAPDLGRSTRVVTPEQATNPSVKARRPWTREIWR